MFDFTKTKFDKYFKSEPDFFSIYFPTAAKLEQHEMINLYTAGWSGEGYQVSVSIPGEPSRELQEEKLRKDTEFAKFSKRQLSIQSTRFLNFPSVDMVYFSTDTRPEMYIFERKFYTTKRGYKILVANKKKNEAEKKFREFIEGFKLLH